MISDFKDDDTLIPFMKMKPRFGVLHHLQRGF